MTENFVLCKRFVKRCWNKIKASFSKTIIVLRKFVTVRNIWIFLAIRAETHFVMARPATPESSDVICDPKVKMRGFWDDPNSKCRGFGHRRNQNLRKIKENCGNASSIKCITERDAECIRAIYGGKHITVTAWFKVKQTFLYTFFCQAKLMNLWQII